MTRHLYPVALAITFLLAASIPCSAGYLLETAQKFELGGYLLMHIRTADADGDGIPDLVGLSQNYDGEGNSAVVVRPGSGDGSFGGPVATLVDYYHWNLRTAMIDDDAVPDLVLYYHYTGSAFTVLLGNGDGTFSEVGQTVTGSFNYMEIGDFTGDGVSDIVVPQGSSVQVHTGQGDGTFTEGPASATADSTWGMTSGDFDEDGDIDLVTAYHDSPGDTFTALLNDGSGSFTMGPSYNLSPWAGPMAAAHIDGDGHLDLLAGDRSGGNSIALRRGNGDGTFQGEAMIAVGDDVEYWDLGDLDGDGDLDVVGNAGIVYTPQVSVVLNNGDGTFGEPAYCFGRGEEIGLEDMDGDGCLDAVMLSPPGGRHAAVLLGRGDGTFRSHRNLGSYLFDVYCLAMEDLDGDGDLDLALGNDNEPDPPVVRVLYNEYPGGFSDPVDFNPDIYVNEMVFGDLDGDGRPDLFVVDEELNRVATMINDGSGGFVDPANMVVGTQPTAAALGDLDGDGDLDAAVAHRSASGLGILLNNGNGSFGSPAFFAATTLSWVVALGDLDGDGDLDAAMDEAQAGGGSVLVLKNNGDGSFAAPVRYECITAAGLAMADLDGDGDLDLATAGLNAGYCSVLVNGGGDFADPVAYETHQQGGWRVAADDVDNDSDQDLVSLGLSSADVAVLFNDGNATFDNVRLYTTGNGGGLMTLGDLDGDADRDLAFMSSYNLLVVESNASSADSTGRLVTGPGPGEFNPTLVRYFPGNGGRGYTEWPAYGVDRWGVNVALGELDGSAGPEVLTGAGPGAVFGPHVRGFRDDGTPLTGVSFLAYGTNKYGVNVAAGDLDGDGYDEIVTGAGPGAVFGPHVRGWNWDGTGVPSPIPGISYFAYGTPKWGVNVSCGDIDGDGYDEIVTGAGPGAVYGPHVRGWNSDGGGAVSIPQVSYLAYGTNKYGVNVSCGDIDGDGIDEIVTGAGPGVVFYPHVRGWSWDGSGAVQAIPAVSFFAYGYTHWGANVSCGDLDGDGIDEIITGPGPGEAHAPRVRGWNYDGQAVSAIAGVDFNAYSPAEVTHGVKVGGLRE